MSKKTTGVAFCCIAGFIFMIPYFAMAISTSGAIINHGVFLKSFGIICISSIAVSACMLVAGIIYFSMAEKKLSVKSILDWCLLNKRDYYRRYKKDLENESEYKKKACYLENWTNKEENAVPSECKNRLDDALTLSPP